jgi:hypothetical protein
VRSLFYIKLTLLLLAIAANFTPPVFAADDTYKRVRLPEGISIEIPGHWIILSQDTRKNIAAAGRAMTDNAGVEGGSNQKQTLLAVNATPAPTGAMIRVSATVPPDYTQGDLARVTPRDLKEVERDALKLFKKMETEGGPEVVEMQPIQVELFKSSRALVIRYVRKSTNGSSLWQVTQYKIPVDNRLFELTLSYRQSDSVIWRPILERVKRSVQF